MHDERFWQPFNQIWYQSSRNALYRISFLPTTADFWCIIQVYGKYTMRLENATAYAVSHKGERLKAVREAIYSSLNKTFLCVRKGICHDSFLLLEQMHTICNVPTVMCIAMSARISIFTPLYQYLAAWTAYLLLFSHAMAPVTAYFEQKKLLLMCKRIATIFVRQLWLLFLVMS